VSKLYETDIGNAAWAVIEPHLPPGLAGRPRSTDPRAVGSDAIVAAARTMSVRVRFENHG